MELIQKFISNFPEIFPGYHMYAPWDIIQNLSEILLEIIDTLGKEYEIKDQIAIHRSAIIEQGVILKPPVIVGENAFIGAHAYLRNGVFLGKSSSVGPACEVKSTIIFQESALAHFNFVGDSIIGNHVNMEAGVILANHYNERNDKRIFVNVFGSLMETNTNKFGSLVGDGTKIGANAVLSPGTILLPGSIVKRLELINQNPEI